MTLAHPSITRIGLTGGIGSGKSAVADCFYRLEVPVIDADLITRELVRPGTPALGEIAETFGKDVLQANGSLDRARLRQRIFNDAAARKRVEAILHPRVRDEIARQTSLLSAPYCIIVIPLLLESGQQDLVDRILVVDAPESLQIERTMDRDQVNREQVEKIVASQASREQRLAIADDVIENNGTLEDLAQKVEALHARYLKLASAQTA